MRTRADLAEHLHVVDPGKLGSTSPNSTTKSGFGVSVTCKTIGSRRPFGQRPDLTLALEAGGLTRACRVRSSGDAGFI